MRAQTPKTITTNKMSIGLKNFKTCPLCENIYSIEDNKCPYCDTYGSREEKKRDKKHG